MASKRSLKIVVPVLIEVSSETLDSYALIENAKEAVAFVLTEEINYSDSPEYFNHQWGLDTIEFIKVLDLDQKATNEWSVLSDGEWKGTGR